MIPDDRAKKSDHPTDRAVNAAAWPGGADLAISLTVDVDIDVDMLDERRFSLSRRSDAEFGARRGLTRLLNVLRESGITGTFYIPGIIGERRPHLVEAIADADHEIGHHGHRHLGPRGLDEADERYELERGKAVLDQIISRPVTAYRAPCWELEPRSLKLLAEYGFTSDSSLMDDDRPYQLTGEGWTITEFPVHWTLDDVPFYGAPDHDRPTISHGRELREVWLAEAIAANRDRRHITLTVHPEVSGRGYRALLLEQVIREISEQMNVWWASHAAVLAYLPMRAGAP
jgi:peptidoglycan-N-acetylglucosamine deacetylase